MLKIPNLEELLLDIYNLTKQAEIDEDTLKQLKREYAGKYKLPQLPTNIQLLRLYNQLVSKGKLDKNEKLESLLRKRKIRSLSGIVPIQVLMKPWFCPGKCIFCPDDISMPKSYINTEPGAMRALLNEFDPIKQVWNRLLSLTLTGHPTDKIEMIVLGGTFDAYPRNYKIEFIKGVYDACNTFEEFLKYVKIDELNPKAARFTIDYSDFNIKFSKTLEEAQKINETAMHRIVGLTIETRPEYVNDKNCKFWRELGVTRIEMGVQSLYDKVLEANKRGNTVRQIAKAFHKMRQYGFKISAHFMPGLYKSSVEEDIGTMKIAYSNKYFKPDEIKFYPTAVLPNTELFELYKIGKYKPLTKEQLEFIINYVKDEIIPPYTRIKRLIRDIPSNEIIAGANITNLRQLVLQERKKKYSKQLYKISQREIINFYKRLWNKLKGMESITFQKIDSLITGNFKSFLEFLPKENEILTYLFFINVGKKEEQFIKKLINTERIFLLQRSFVCLCTRCREVRNKKSSKNLKKGNSLQENSIGIEDVDVLVVRKYLSSVGEEYFISFEDILGYLYGFARLLLPKVKEVVERQGLGKDTAIIRELHVYGQQVKIGYGCTGGIQHKGFGGKLMKVAELISEYKGYKKVSVISGIGVRQYYKKLGYELEGTYMVKFL